MSIESSLETRVRSWIRIDPDPVTRASLGEALERGDSKELGELFGGRITFGTAGIRGPLGPGPMRMNRVVVRLTAAGIARELLATVEGCRHRGVVVGHDARHGSTAFSGDVLDVFRSHGFDVYSFGEAVPTPLVAFAVGHLHAAAGIMVTASHNPAADNGMKVYWEDGAQIIPPIDTQIARIVADLTDESMGQVQAPDAGPAGHRSRTSTEENQPGSGQLGPVPHESVPHESGPLGSVLHLGGPETDDHVVRAYLRQGLLLTSPNRPTAAEASAGAAVRARARARASAAGARAGAELVAPVEPVTIAATSLHGVGSFLLHRLLSDGGFDDIHMVESQQLPDPDFPTVTFPNPEEPGALDQLLELAQEVNADVAIANDPDADRLGAAFREASGGWRPLKGDELGALLAYRLLAKTEGIPRRLLATTVVSSRLIARMAEAAEVEFSETLTGFKWLCRPGLDDPSIHQVLLYEEALGYAVGPTVRDKDGITAALVLSDMVRDLKAAGTTVWDILDELAIDHGAHVQLNSSIRIEGADWADQVSGLMERILKNPPTSLAGQQVVSSDRPAGDVLRFFLADRSRVVVRPSGTEPKVKLYCEAIETVDVADAVERARRTAGQRLQLIDADLKRLILDPS